MHDSPSGLPRWGNEGREHKAATVLKTLQQFSAFDLTAAHWLDVGCGSGGIAGALANGVTHLTGLDPQPWPQWAELMKEHSNLRLMQGGYDTDALAPGSIDVVICNQVYEHVPDPVKLIRFIHTVLRPGGIAYFAGPNLLFPIEPHTLWPFVHWLPRRIAVGVMRACGSHKILDANSASYWKLRTWLTGFKVINAVPYILRHPAEFGRSSLAWRSVAIIPAPALDTLTFLSPGFVFVLIKH